MEVKSRELLFQQSLQNEGMRLLGNGVHLSNLGFLEKTKVVFFFQGPKPTSANKKALRYACTDQS